VHEPKAGSKGNKSMLDAIFVLTAVGFFLASAAYAHFCERA
jgi:hypothetical protein